MDKTQNLLEKFLETVELTGTCGFWVEKEINENGKYSIYIILDIDWIQKVPTKPEFVAKRMRMWLANEVNKFLGLDVDVRSTAEKCS